MMKHDDDIVVAVAVLSAVVVVTVQQGRRQGFRPGWAKFGATFFFRLPTLVFSLPTLPYVTVAHPAHPTARGGFNGKGLVCH